MTMNLYLVERINVFTCRITGPTSKECSRRVYKELYASAESDEGV